MAWTLTAAVTHRKGNYIKVKIACTSDGNAMSATDILALAPTGTGTISLPTIGRTLKDELEAVTLMVAKADPGSGATQPDQAWDFTLSDDEGDAFYTASDASATAVSWHDLSTDISMYPGVFDKIYLAFPTAADWSASDTVDIYIIGWREKPF